MAQDSSTGPRPRLLLALALLAGPLSIASTACSGPTAAESVMDNAIQELEPPAERSYDNPDVALTDQEFAEIDSFCEATMACVRERCDVDQHKVKFKRVKVKSNWGNKLQDHFVNEPLDKVGRKLGQLVEQEGLHHKSSACRRVRARFD